MVWPRSEQILPASALEEANAPQWLSAESILRGSELAPLIGGLEAALRRSADVADAPRSRIGSPQGALLLMPAGGTDFLGAKVVTVFDKPQADRPLVQGIYVLFDAHSFAPVALFDAAALTAVRTAAVSAMAARHLVRREPRRLVVFGTGVQARSHVLALRELFALDSIEIVGTSAASAERFARAMQDTDGVPIRAGEPSAVAEADLVVCCTTSATPLFRGEQVRDGSTVLAVGAFEPHRRELDTQLVSRSLVVVESIVSALAEAGDVAIPVAEGALDPADLVTIGDLVRKPLVAQPGPTVFKGTGMSWQDLAVAQSIYSTHGGQ